MFNAADVRDRTTLLRQAFDQWFDAHTLLVEAKKTQAVFEELEEKAGRARDLYLITKAFTHWALSAAEQAEKTRAARRHLLRTKYFNAWKKITTANELKVRNYILGKHLDSWRRKTAERYDQEQVALDFEKQRQCEKGYRRWFWQFCDKRAPSWYESKLKGSCFDTWLLAARQAKIRNTWATDFRDVELVRICTQTWCTRSEKVRRDVHQALKYRSRTLLLPTAATLQKELELAPLQRRLSRLIDARIAGSALRVLADRGRLMQQAGHVNESRIMRNAWTTWNDRLRCQSLSRTIDDRLLLQTMYRWVVAERAALFERVRKENQKGRIFAHWRKKTTNLCATLGECQHLTKSALERRAKTSALRIWSTKAQTQTEEATRANIFHAKTLTRSTLGTWAQRVRHTSQLGVVVRRRQLLRISLSKRKGMASSNRRAQTSKTPRSLRCHS